MLKKLRNRLLLVNMTSGALIIILAFAVIFTLAYTTMQRFNTERLKSIPPDVMINALAALQDDASIQTQSQPNYITISPGLNLPIDGTKSFVINIDRSGESLSVFSRIELTREDYMAAVQDVMRIGADTGRLRLADRNWQYLLVSMRNGGESIIFLDIADTDLALLSILIGMLIVAVCVLAALFFVSYRVVNRAIRPVEESIEKQRRFITDASHELKTPLAIIDSNTEVLIAGAEESVNSQRKWIDRISEESARMRGLIENMLYLAKAENVALDTVPFDLGDAAEDGIRRVEAVLFERGVTLSFQNEPAVIVKAEAERIQEAILILLDNAVKYTDDGGKAMVVTGRTKHCGFIRVENTGEGIPADELPRIFDRFYRVDKARNSAAGGFGLGLSIAKSLVERSGGKITATSANGLTSFTIELPLHNGNLY